MEGEKCQGSGGSSESKLIEKLQDLRPWPTECCIYKVPATLRSINKSAYTPSVVSIGPLHHGAAELHEMEVHKHMYLNLLLARNSDISLEGLIQVVRGLEERARNSYQQEFTRRFTSGQFVDIMLLDGCFIITFLLFWSRHYARKEHDPMFDGKILYNTVRKDLLLLENQVPLFILEQLYCFIFPSSQPQSFFNFMFMCFWSKMQENQFITLISSVSDNHYHQVKHIVDLILKCNLPSKVDQIPTWNDKKSIELPSATELRKSGIKFRRGVSKCFLDLKFSNGVLEIPYLCVEDRTELFFRNLIAMEQCHGSSTSYITNYFALMDSLIDTPNDVALLRNCGVIDNSLGSDEDVCQLFNNIGKEVYTSGSAESQYYGILVEVSAYYNKRWNLWKAHLKRDYFQNPWTIISLVAALILLICTLIQAVCSVISVA